MRIGRTSGQALWDVARGRTGAIVVTDRRSGHRARVFTVDGCAYAVELDHYAPSITDRIVAQGEVNEDDIRALALSTADSGRPIGRVAVERGLIAIDALAAIHQELLVAGVGALSTLRSVRVEFEEGVTTGEQCALPVDLDELRALVQVRRERTEATWRTVTLQGSPVDTGLVVSGRHVSGDAPEVAAFLTEAGRGGSVDAVAGRLGLTRAEAVHLAALVVLQRRAEAVSVPVEQSDHYVVPEQFGSVDLGSPRATTTADTGAPDSTDVAELHRLIADLESRLEQARADLARAVMAGVGGSS